MSDVPTPSPSVPGLPPLPPGDLEAAPPRSGCLKWGLVGCAGASVLLIVGLLILLNNARGMMDWAMTKMSDQVLDATAADVPAEDREAFSAAFQAFREKAKTGRLTPSQIQDFQKKTVSAVADGRVTADELRELTAALKELAP